MPDTPPDRIAFTSSSVLKTDVFSCIERGVAVTPDGPVAAVRRDTRAARLWAAPVARVLHWRERRALRRIRGIAGVTQLIAADRGVLVRTWLDGLPMQVARPFGNAAFFRSAKTLLRRLRRIGVAHNDLAKEPNWLVGPDGEAAVTDFQLASLHHPRSPVLRLLAREDLRHLLKHKRKYCPDALTPAERRLLSRRSAPFRAGRAVKPAYAFLTRRLLGIRDREGGGLRFIDEAPAIERCLADARGIDGAVVVSFHRLSGGVGLHAFVETGATAEAVRTALAERIDGIAPPERLTVAPTLPRGPDGAILRQALFLIATGQIDQLDAVIPDAATRAVVADVAGRATNADEAA